MVDDVIIMAGGSGTRLWPASIRSRPKQFMDPGLGTSLLEATVRRAASLGTTGEIVIVAHADHVDAIVEECLALPEELRSRISVLGEPEAKNTAPAIALSMAYVDVGRRAALAAGGAAPAAGTEDDGSGSPAAGTAGTEEHASAAAGGTSRTVLVLAADHLITPLELFRDAVSAADELAREGYLVTFGVTPTRAETGYGYIEAGEEHGPGNLVAAFREKPDRDTAEGYYASGRHYWNSGMLVFESGVFRRELAAAAPEVSEAFSVLGSAAPSGTEEETSRASPPAGARSLAGRLEGGVCVLGDPAALARLYNRAPKISIDYALMEQSKNVAMVPAGFTWNDIGSWDEIATLTDRGVLDPAAALAGGAGAGESGQDAAAGASPAVVEVEGGNNFVFSELPVALAGVENVIVVVQNGRVLVAKRGESQLVKHVVEEFAQRGQSDIL